MNRLLILVTSFALFQPAFAGSVNASATYVAEGWVVRTTTLDTLKGVIHIPVNKGVVDYSTLTDGVSFGDSIKSRRYKPSELIAFGFMVDDAIHHYISITRPGRSKPVFLNSIVYGRISLLSNAVVEYTNASNNYNRTIFKPKAASKTTETRTIYYLLVDGAIEQINYNQQTGTFTTKELVTAVPDLQLFLADAGERIDVSGLVKVLGNINRTPREGLLNPAAGIDSLTYYLTNGKWFLQSLKMGAMKHTYSAKEQAQNWVLFNIDLTYESMDSGKKSRSTWSYNAKTKIIATAEQGGMEKMKVVSISASQLIVMIDEGGGETSTLTFVH